MEQEIPAKDADGKGVPQESAGKEVGGDAEEEAAVKEKGGSQSPEESGAKKA